MYGLCFVEGILRESSIDLRFTSVATVAVGIRFEISLRNTTRMARDLVVMATVD